MVDSRPDVGALQENPVVLGWAQPPGGGIAFSDLLMLVTGARSGRFITEQE